MSNKKKCLIAWIIPLIILSGLIYFLLISIESFDGIGKGFAEYIPPYNDHLCNPNNNCFKGSYIKI